MFIRHYIQEAGLIQGTLVFVVLSLFALGAARSAGAGEEVDGNPRRENTQARKNPRRSGASSWKRMPIGCSSRKQPNDRLPVPWTMRNTREPLSVRPVTFHSSSQKQSSTPGPGGQAFTSRSQVGWARRRTSNYFCPETSIIVFAVGVIRGIYSETALLRRARDGATTVLPFGSSPIVKNCPCSENRPESPNPQYVYPGPENVLERTTRGVENLSLPN